MVRSPFERAPNAGREVGAGTVEYTDGESDATSDEAALTQDARTDAAAAAPPSQQIQDANRGTDAVPHELEADNVGDDVQAWESDGQRFRFDELCEAMGSGNPEARAAASDAMIEYMVDTLAEENEHDDHVDYSHPDSDDDPLGLRTLAA